MLRIALFVLFLGTPYLSDFTNLFSTIWAADEVDAGGHWDPLGSGDGAETLKPGEDRGVGWDPNG